MLCNVFTLADYKKYVEPIRDELEVKHRLGTDGCVITRDKFTDVVDCYLRVRVGWRGWLLNHCCLK